MKYESESVWGFVVPVWLGGTLLFPVLVPCFFLTWVAGLAYRLGFEMARVARMDTEAYRWQEWTLIVYVCTTPWAIGVVVWMVTR